MWWTRAVELNIHIDGPAVGAVLALIGVFIGLWVNGDRAERDRRRRLHARALKAIVDYGEMPFMIRRRQYEEEERSAERVRLSDHFSGVEAEISTCQVLLGADGDEKLAASYDQLFETARSTVGREAHLAWTEPAIISDEEMNMGPLSENLGPFRLQLDRFKDDLAHATLPRRMRLVRRAGKARDERPVTIAGA
jgi:hypothetical protein